MLEKALVHLLAAKFTEVVMSKVKIDAPADASLADKNLRAAIDTSVEVHKVFYSWIAGSFADDTWKSPAFNTTMIANLLGMNSNQISGIISSLVGKFISGAVGSNVPNTTPLSGSSIIGSGSK